jgi:hypothetical protein
MSRSLEEIHDQLVAAVEGLVTSEQWRAMLEVSARLHNYSTNNQLLIYLQCPEATRVCGYRAWQRLGRQVKKGERGIRILAPCRKRVSPTEAVGKQNEVERIEILTGFRVVHVFAISQTEGDELADVAPRRLTGEVSQQLIDALEQRVVEEGFTLRREAIARSARNGYADFELRLVVVRDDLSGAQTAKTLIHELAHLLLHGDTDLSERAVAEVEAESVAFVVSSGLGLDTSDYSFPYVARWSGGNAEVVAATAERVIGAARDILTSIAELSETRISLSLIRSHPSTPSTTTSAPTKRSASAPLPSTGHPSPSSSRTGCRRRTLRLDSSGSALNVSARIRRRGCDKEATGVVRQVGIGA